MKTDMISIFNHLTSNSELGDFDIFSTMLDKHFLKFRYFHFLFKKIDVSKISSLYSDVSESCIKIHITVNDISYINKMKSIIKKNYNKYKHYEIFTIDTSICETKFIINIQLNNIDKEGEFYGCL